MVALAVQELEWILPAKSSDIAPGQSGCSRSATQRTEEPDQVDSGCLDSAFAPDPDGSPSRWSNGISPRSRRDIAVRRTTACAIRVGRISASTTVKAGQRNLSVPRQSVDVMLLEPSGRSSRLAKSTALDIHTARRVKASSVSDVFSRLCIVDDEADAVPGSTTFMLLAASVATFGSRLPLDKCKVSHIVSEHE